MKIHPYCDLFPSVDESTLADMARDIGDHGLRVKIVTLGGAVLDGKNRLAACKLAKVTPEFVEYDGPTDDAALLAYVTSMNLPRRHLSVVQRAYIAAEMAKLVKGNPSNAQRCAFDEKPPVTQQQAADLMNVGRRTVQEARKVGDKGTDEEIAATKSGEVSLSRTAKEIQRKEKEIRDAAQADPDRFGDLAAKLDEPGAKVDPIHREFRKREKAGTRKKDVLKDALGVDVPAGLRDLFGDTWIMQVAEAVEHFARDALKDCRKKVEGKGGRYRYMHGGKILKALDAAKLELETAHALLTEARPHAVHRACEGKGCDDCLNCGWLPRFRFLELKKEGKA